MADNIKFLEVEDFDETQRPPKKSKEEKANYKAGKEYLVQWGFPNYRFRNKDRTEYPIREYATFSGGVVRKVKWALKAEKRMIKLNERINKFNKGLEKQEGKQNKQAGKQEKEKVIKKTEADKEKERTAKRKAALKIAVNRVRLESRFGKKNIRPGLLRDQAYNEVMSGVSGKGKRDKKMRAKSVKDYAKSVIEIESRGVNLMEGGMKVFGPVYSVFKGKPYKPKETPAYDYEGARRLMAKTPKKKRIAYEQAKAMGTEIYSEAKNIVTAVVTQAPSPTYVAKKVLTYKQSKGWQQATKTVNRGVSSISKALFMSPLNTSSRGRGRPSGPSGRYRVEGKSVYENEFQQYKAKQNAMNRMSPSTVQTAPITQEYIQQMQEQQMQDQLQKQLQQESPQSYNPPKNQPTYQQAQPMPQEYQDYSLENRRQQQMQEQENDNILKAPNFSKGELKATGGSILTPNGPQILDAPQFNKGEMRTLNRGNPQEIAEVKLGVRPQTNPGADLYMDVELGSGKPVLKKRISERWMTGESL